MDGIHKSRVWRAGALLRRGFWLALLILHAGAILSASASLGGIDVEAGPAVLFRLSGLVLASAFFLLKVLDVGWLRLKPGWRPALSCAAIAALLHVNVVARAAPQAVTAAAAPFGTVLFLGCVLDADALRRSASALGWSRDPPRRPRLPGLFYNPVWTVPNGTTLPLMSYLRHGPTAPRAPPL